MFFVKNDNIVSVSCVLCNDDTLGATKKEGQIKGGWTTRQPFLEGFHFSEFAFWSQMVQKNPTKIGE